MIGRGEEDEDEIEEEDEDEDLNDEYIPSGFRAGGGGHGAGLVQNHNWHPDCRCGSRKLNLIFGEVARAYRNVSDDHKLDVDVEFNELANQSSFCTFFCQDRDRSGPRSF